MTREEAIEELKKAYPKKCIEVNYVLKGGFDDHDKPLGQALDMAIEALEQEPLTDREQRIFLSAMGREERVCREVDAEHPNENSEDTLLSICRSITRKVKGALWG